MLVTILTLSMFLSAAEKHKSFSAVQSTFHHMHTHIHILVLIQTQTLTSTHTNIDIYQYSYTFDSVNILVVMCTLIFSLLCSTSISTAHLDLLDSAIVDNLLYICSRLIDCQLICVQHIYTWQVDHMCCIIIIVFLLFNILNIKINLLDCVVLHTIKVCSLLTYVTKKAKTRNILDYFMQ